MVVSDRSVALIRFGPIHITKLVISYLQVHAVIVGRLDWFAFVRASFASPGLIIFLGRFTALPSRHRGYKNPFHICSGGNA